MVDLPVVIQGGMGVGVSGWRLANAVSSDGQLGVVSGTAIDAVFVRRLQLGDPDGSTRRALDAFPLRDVAERIIDKYFVEGGKSADAAFRGRPMPTETQRRGPMDLVLAANFVEVFLAKEGHTNPVGVNYLEKIQVQTLASIYGAMLAGVDYVLMGAGIPKAIPAVIERFARGEDAELRLDVKQSERDHKTHLSPASLFGGQPPNLRAPRFLAIVASHVLATMLSRSDVPPYGFIVEGPTAGGHNAPPRAKARTATGEPEYGPRDEPDLEVFAKLGKPFWLAGSQASAESVVEATAAGAVGVQVGSAFAFCEESDLRSDLKATVIEGSARGDVEVFTDPDASPTGFPFKVIQMEETLSDNTLYEERERVCDLGYLRSPYEKENGRLGWRCPAEPKSVFVEKGGALDETTDRQCLCNALMSNIGLGQTRSGGTEQPLLTAGDDVVNVARFLSPGATTYRATDVIKLLTSQL